ncbi:MAG TPA: PAS domain-containing protein [Dongiaceae bacterium]|nr:PAS domain-containing protein [Dongiaceae bacterium]
MSAFEEFEVCRGILESLLTGVCVVDMQKKIVFWSDGAERITGHLRHEVIGRSCIAEPLLHCDQKGCEFCSEECAVATAIKTVHPVQTIGFLHHKSGYEVPVRIHAVPVHNQHGSIIGAVETFEDLQQDDVKQSEESVPGCVDEVTGIASKLRMKWNLREAMAAFTDLQIPFGVLRFRLQGLAQFRAAFGSHAADSLLRVVARSLVSDLLRTDSVGRWANDEFMVILNGCRRESLGSVRERLRRMLANDFIEWWGERRSLPVSIGEVFAQPGDTIESLLESTQKSLEASSAWRIQAAAVGSSHSPGS